MRANMRPMLTAIVSDLHLGITSGADVARRAEPLSRLLEAVADADRLVVLGDLLELRERPAADVLEVAAPVLGQIDEAMAGKQVVLVPGNHDYPLVSPALERARLGNGGALPLEGEYQPEAGDLGGRVVALMPRSEVTFAYPGVWLREDVYALHGHYLDVHLTVPRVECLVAAAFERYATDIGSAGPISVRDYEAVLSPVYALAHAVAQNARGLSVTRGNNLSRRVWSSATADGGLGTRLRSAVLGKAAIPAAVMAINSAGFGPFKPDISAIELRRAALLAIGEVVDRLGIEAEHVVFGHTHRAGPLDRDSGEWVLPNGTRLTNTGSWIYEDVFLDDGGPANPYWPGRVALLGDEGPPELRTVLDSLD